MKLFQLVLSLSLLSAPVFAAPSSIISSILTAEEAEQLQTFNGQYESTIHSLGLSDKQNELSLLLDAKREATVNRVNALSQTEELIKAFRQSIDRHESSAKVLEQLRAQSEYIYAEQAKIDELTTQIGQLNNDIESITKKVAQAAWERESDIQALKDSIESRLKREGSIVRDVKVQGETKCSPSQSLTSCLKQKTDLLVESYFNKENIAAQVDSSLLSSANMDLSGLVHYSIDVKYRVPYSAATSRSLNFALGIKSISFTLSSNVKASYYLDGNKVGEGLEVTVIGEYYGNRVIEAQYDGARQSSIENLNDNGSYYYPFSSH